MMRLTDGSRDLTGECADICVFPFNIYRVIARSESDEAIQLSVMPHMDCFAGRMTSKRVIPRLNRRFLS